MSNLASAMRRDPFFTPLGAVRWGVVHQLTELLSQQIPFSLADGKSTGSAALNPTSPLSYENCARQPCNSASSANLARTVSIRKESAQPRYASLAADWPILVSCGHCPPEWIRPDPGAATRAGNISVRTLLSPAMDEMFGDLNAKSRLSIRERAVQDGSYLKNIGFRCPILRASFGENAPFGNALLGGVPLLAAEAIGHEILRRGTLFLNEIALLDRTQQVRLMEKIEEGSLLRTDPLHGQSLDLRAICVTSRQLGGEVEAWTFLRGLFYLVRVVALEVPQLRERRGDIPELTT
jgi:hypothetical protein